MWIAWFASFASAQTYRGDFGNAPSLVPPPQPVEVTRTVSGTTLPSLPDSPLRFQDGTTMVLEAGPSEPEARPFELERPEGPARSFVRSGEGVVCLDEEGVVWTIELTPRGLRGRRKLEAWVIAQVEPWLDRLTTGGEPDSK